LKSFKLGFHPDTVTINTLIKGLYLNGKVREALHFHDDALFKNHQVDKAIALLTKIKDQGIEPDMFTCTILVDGLCKNGRLQDAQQVYQDLLINGYHLDARMYTVMLNGLCKEGLFDEAIAAIVIVTAIFCFCSLHTLQLQSVSIDPVSIL